MGQKPLTGFDDFADLTSHQVEFMDALCMHTHELNAAPDWQDLMSFLNMRESQFWGTVSNLVTKCYITKELGFNKIHFTEKGLGYYRASYPQDMQGILEHEKEEYGPEDMGFHVIPTTIEEIDVLVAKLQAKREALTPKTKYCRSCENDKLVSEFGPNRATEDGLQSWCKVCQADYSREWKLAEHDLKRISVFRKGQLIRRAIKYLKTRLEAYEKE